MHFNTTSHAVASEFTPTLQCTRKVWRQVCDAQLNMAMLCFLKPFVQLDSFVANLLQNKCTFMGVGGG
uniref:Uncharacterized protein n=1 Tax=Anguilla anguilla TaxID=7936 RepID=A0A0E9XBY9_ANGAN